VLCEGPVKISVNDFSIIVEKELHLNEINLVFSFLERSRVLENVSLSKINCKHS
jgi:hypothetical protein